MEVDTPLAPLVDAAQPVAVLLQLVAVVLQHVLLHLLQLVGIAGLGQRVHLVAEDHYSGVTLLRFHRTVGQNLGAGLEVAAADTSLCHHRIGSTGILTDLLQILHAQDLSCHRGLDAVLQRVRHLV